MTLTAAQRLPETMRQINDLIWESLDDDGYSEPAPFFCECEREGCYRAVWLTPEEYAESRRRPGWLAVVPAHARAVAR